MLFLVMRFVSVIFEQISCLLDYNEGEARYKFIYKIPVFALLKLLIGILLI